MKQSSLVVIWLLFFFVIFCLGFGITHAVVTRAMNDYQADKLSQEQ